MAKQKFYVVWRGRQPGIYTTWPAAEEQVRGFAGAQYKAFGSREEAEALIRQPVEGVFRWAPEAVEAILRAYPFRELTEERGQDRGDRGPAPHRVPPCPALSAALNYVDSYRAERLPAHRACAPRQHQRDHSEDEGQ